MKKNRIILRIMIVAVGFLILAAMLFYYYLFNPTQEKNFFPACSFKATTGLDCVGCGIQRAIYSLLHGKLWDAIDYNALFVFLLPLLSIYIYYSLRRFILGKPSPNIFIYQHKFGIFIIVIVVLFLILRNLPINYIEWLNSSK